MKGEASCLKISAGGETIKLNCYRLRSSMAQGDVLFIVSLGMVGSRIDLNSSKVMLETKTHVEE